MRTEKIGLRDFRWKRRVPEVLRYRDTRWLAEAAAKEPEHCQRMKKALLLDIYVNNYLDTEKKLSDPIESPAFYLTIKIFFLRVVAQPRSCDHAVS